MSEAKDVQRYDFAHPSCKGYGCCGGGRVEPDEYGDYVRYADYDALSTQLAAAEQRATYEADVAAQAIAAKEAAERERDAHERELHDECVMLHTALIGRNCAEEGAVGACHPMVCDCGTPYEDYTFRDLCEAVALLRTHAERAEAVCEAADALVSYQGTDVEPQAWDTLNSVLGAYRNGGPV